ncbi:MAG: peptide chain release factor N(5)-glutamine methyltransferase [Candidatus Eiseniibacteriota bacterium]|nr:MAG: peptide chain release factor N(5)-glutamine methyltransferase [Candidatus Eisenbacteria bacterium]
MTVSEFLSISVRTLNQAGIENPQLQAQALLSAVLGVDRAGLLLAGGEELSGSQLGEAKKLLERRVSRVPLEYLTGKVEFLGRDFSIATGVFIPRPETELLAIEAERKLEGVRSPSVLELGTGSGVVAVTLALRCGGAIVHANDVSRRAIEIARLNAAAHEVSDRVLLHVGDLFSALDTRRIAGRLHLLVSNPPYVCSSEIPLLAPEVSRHEPTAALDGGDDGLRYVREILRQGPHLLAKDGWLVLEIGVNQAQEARRAAVAAGLEAVETVRDLSGIERILVARKS